MKHVILFLFAFVAVVSAQDGVKECSVYSPCKSTVSSEGESSLSSYSEPVLNDARKQGNSGFFFDLTVGGSLRHLSAVKKIYHSATDDKPGCHFEMDGRYVCDGPYTSSRQSWNEERDLGYTGMGPLFMARFGGVFRGMFAVFANLELEITRGDVSGWNENDRKPRSVFIGGGPGVTVYPFFRSGDGLENMYVTVAGDILLGGGGGIGLMGVNAMLETGYLWQMSDRIFAGPAIGGDILTTGDLSEDMSDEGGFCIWIGLKIVRK